MFKELNICQPFFKEPLREFGIRETARILKLSPATVSTQLTQLEKAKILRSRKEHNLILYQANRDAPEYKDLKTFHTIKRIREHLMPLIDRSYLYPTLVVLFGSASRGQDSEKSDIDLFILSVSPPEIPPKELRNACEQKLDRELQIIAAKRIQDVPNPHLVANLRQGIVLSGSWT